MGQAAAVKRLDVVVMRLINTLCRQHAMLCSEILFFFRTLNESTFSRGPADPRGGRDTGGPGHSGDRGTVPVPVTL